MPGPQETPWGTGTAGWYYFFDQVIASEGRKYNGVVSGLEVTPSGTPSLTLNVAAGTFHQGSSLVTNENYAGGTVTISAADANYPRVDYVSVYWNGSTAIAMVTTGLPDTSSPMPAVPIPTLRGAGIFNVVLAVVLVYPGATQILEEHIYDRRFFISGTVSITGAPNVGQLAQFSGNTEITNGNLVGDVTTTNSTTTAIGANKVTNAMLAQMAALTMKGNDTGSPADVKNLTVAEVLALLGMAGFPSIRTVRLGSSPSVVASMTGVEVTGLRFSSVAVGTYLAIYALCYQSDTSGTGVRYGITAGGGGGVMFTSMAAGSAGAHDQDSPSPVNLTGMAGRAPASTTLPVVSVSVDTANMPMMVLLFGWVDISTVADLSLYHACEVASGTITTLQNSGGVLIKMG